MAAAPPASPASTAPATPQGASCSPTPPSTRAASPPRTPSARRAAWTCGPCLAAYTRTRSTPPSASATRKRGPPAAQVRVGLADLSANARAAALGQPEGVVKLVADARTGEILGVHILGPQASELIGQAVLAMRLEATVYDLAATVHWHPSLSEALTEAARRALPTRRQTMKYVRFFYQGREACGLLEGRARWRPWWVTSSASDGPGRPAAAGRADAAAARPAVEDHRGGPELHGPPAHRRRLRLRQADPPRRERIGSRPARPSCS